MADGSEVNLFECSHLNGAFVKKKKLAEILTNSYKSERTVLLMKMLDGSESEVKKLSLRSLRDLIEGEIMKNDDDFANIIVSHKWYRTALRLKMPDGKDDNWSL